MANTCARSLLVPDFFHESQFQVPYVAGLDEAGCGPWAGPVVAGAVILLPAFPKALQGALNDSKKLTARRRETLFHALQKENGHTCHYGVGQASVEEIDHLNIRQAALLAMKRAFEALALSPQAALVDGIAMPALPCAVECLPKGDALSLSVAAASIVAKVTRDHLMQALAQEYPAYAWEKNAGYGTKAHSLALQQHGVTPHHRRSFAPIRHLLTLKTAA